ncbi:hypothetical protein [Streptomyces sp. NPDC057428]|uniref:hypothetical protein n=1 Tax=Streptomyces sp. NPDC057428 TaxID=3346129 RepID=UPI0036A16DA1
MKNPTHPGPPVERPLRLVTDPPPVPGCDVCNALAKARDTARSAGDMSKVSDMNVEIREHPHGTRPRRS